MNTSMAAAKMRIFIVLLMVCVAVFGWEASRNAKMQPVTGYVIGKVYRGYIIRYEMQEHSYQFETRLGIVDVIRGLGSLPLNAPVPVKADPAKPHAALINTLSGRYGLTMTFVTLLLLFVVAMGLVAVRHSNTAD